MSALIMMILLTVIITIEYYSDLLMPYKQGNLLKHKLFFRPKLKDLVTMFSKKVMWLYQVLFK